MIECKAWEGSDLRGVWDIFRKLDGVRALKVDGAVLSRHGKPLYNLDRFNFTDAEIWLGDFKSTIQAVRTQSYMTIEPMNIYQLDPPDGRLLLGFVADPSIADIKQLLSQFKAPGEDGLVLRQGTLWVKVKHEETFDVRVNGIQPGTGKHEGRMGALLTSLGKVGTGFSDVEREYLFWVGKVIEVSCLGLTADGKFRHPRFVRIRDDK